MLDKIIKVIAGFFCVLLIMIGVGWLLDPSSAAEGLGMTLFEGLGRSSQIGDMSSFFIVGGTFALIGVIRNNASFLLMSASLVGFTAITRTIAWGVHDASFATQQIVVEVVICSVLLLARSRIGSSS
jgi:hypothetical protein